MGGRRRILFLLAAALGATTPGAAQDSPREVAEAFFKAVAEERWRDAARLLDLAAFDRYRRERIAMARLPQPRPRAITAEEFMRHDPDMPRAVAEYQARKANEMRPQFSWVDYEFAGVTSVDSLASMSVEESAARWLQARDIRWASRRARETAARGGRCPPDLDLHLGPPEVVAPHEIVGVMVSDSVAYVLHADPAFRPRRPDAELEAPGPAVMQLRRVRGRWRVVPRYDVLREGLNSFVSVECTPADSAPRRRPGDR